jgi:hypothetical protein
MKRKLEKRITWTVLLLIVLLVSLSFSSSTGATAELPVLSNIMVMDSSPFTCPVDMLAYWKLDEADGSTSFKDYYGSNDGVCTDKCPTPGEGFLNNAQVFSGNQEIKIPSIEVFNWTSENDFSIEIWVNIPPEETCEGSKIFLSRHAGDQAWWVGCDHISNKAVFSMRDSQRIGLEISGGEALNDGNWHLVVALHDGKKDENRLYVDGVLVKSGSVTYLGNWISQRELNIGHHDVLTDPAGSKYYFSGMLDEIAIYGKALSLAEIQYHYERGLVGKNYCEPVNLTLYTQGEGVVEKSPNDPYAFGQVVSLNAIPELGAIFYSWSGEFEGFDNPATIIMDSDKVITATFSQPISYQLTTSTIGQGRIIVDPYLPEYLHLTSVKVLAIPEAGWIFAGWSGDLSGNNTPVEVLMTTDLAISASFVESKNKVFIPVILR